MLVVFVHYVHSTPKLWINFLTGRIFHNMNVNFEDNRLLLPSCLESFKNGHL